MTHHHQIKKKMYDCKNKNIQLKHFKCFFKMLSQSCDSCPVSCVLDQCTLTELMTQS